ncbi:GNAT family N-acetyltransferase [Williamsia herbipolensis]|uniref:GNAT family N-acetyltransferase n=1 Tax=Williamsia herbipolensis TaxID=1603258 RepID=UPI000ADFB1AC|nr:GNAT family N-acetyltransferase [Williamsia herbipolensis]
MPAEPHERNIDRAGAAAPALRRAHTADLSASDLAAIRALMTDAFAGDFDDDDFDHALGGVHVIAQGASGDVLGHAAVVQRQLAVGDRVCRVGYVEAVAVSSAAQRQGLGSALMAAVEDIVDAAYDIGALAASEAGMRLYRSRGWVPWEGPLRAVAAEGVVDTPDDQDCVLVFGAPIRTGAIDLGAVLVADRRRGDPW